jgi:hypothetical protein
VHLRAKRKGINARRNRVYPIYLLSSTGVELPERKTIIFIIFLLFVDFDIVSYTVGGLIIWIRITRPLLVLITVILVQITRSQRKVSSYELFLKFRKAKITAPKFARSVLNMFLKHVC